VKCKYISHSPCIATEQIALHSIAKREIKKKYVIEITVDV